MVGAALARRHLRFFIRGGPGQVVKVLAAVVLLSALTGCSTVVDKKDEARCGPRPTEEEAKKAVQQYVDSYSDKGPTKIQVRDIAVENREKWSKSGQEYGWRISFQLSVKTVTGGYGPFEPGTVWRSSEGRTYWRTPPKVRGFVRFVKPNQEAWCGLGPTEEEAKKVIEAYVDDDANRFQKDHIMTQVRDIEIGGRRKDMVGGPVWEHWGWTYGWVICFQWSQEKSSGGYGPFVQETILFKDGKILSGLHGTDGGGGYGDVGGLGGIGIPFSYGAPCPHHH